MNVFLVYAHPEPRSFNAEMRDLAVDVLDSAGHQVTVSDLYAMRFEAEGGPQDFLDLQDAGHFDYQREQRHAAATDGFVPPLAEEMEKVLWSDFVLLQFPLWWSSFPAILKGWVDRVLAMGFAYDAGHSHETGLLRGRRSMLALTTGGPPFQLAPDGPGGKVDRLLYPIHYGVLHLVGLEVLPPFVAPGGSLRDGEGRGACLEAYRDRLVALHSTPPLRFDLGARIGK